MKAISKDCFFFLRSSLFRLPFVCWVVSNAPWLYAEIVELLEPRSADRAHTFILMSIWVLFRCASHHWRKYYYLIERSGDHTKWNKKEQTIELVRCLLMSFEKKTFTISSTARAQNWHSAAAAPLAFYPTTKTNAKTTTMAWTAWIG